MRIGDYIRSVRHTFASNRARSTLTLLGIVIGSASIVLLAGLMKGGLESLQSTSQRANEADMISVRTDEPPAKELGRTQRVLSRRDATALGDSRLLDKAGVTAEMTHESLAAWRDHTKRVRMVSAHPASLELYHLGLERGRYLMQEDFDQRRRVAVVGQEVWRELLDSSASLDNLSFTADNQKWTVVGVLKNKPLLGGGGDGTWMWNRKALIPESTFDSIYEPSHRVRRVFVRLQGAGDLAKRMAAVSDVVTKTLLRRHLGVHNFKIESDENEGNQEKMILLIIQILLLGTGLLSLLVGGINIMNIMLVTVTERTREIGIRRALGAPPGSILRQFVLESGLISLVGGVMGVLAGVGLSWLAAKGLGNALGGWNFYVETWSVALGLALSVGTGVVFGIYPAWRAARLDPVTALRYE